MLTSLLNPCLVFAGTWTLVLFLHALGLFDLNQKSDVNLTVFILCTVMISLGMGIYTRRRPAVMPNRPRTQRFVWLIRILWIAFILETARQYLWYGTTPLQSAFGHGDVTYLDANMTFNVTHTLFIKENIGFLSCAYLVQYAFYRQKRFLLGYLFCVAWSFVLVSRAILIPIISISAIIYLSFEWRPARALSVAAVGAIFMIGAFGWLQEARYNTFNPHHTNIYGETASLPILEKGLGTFYLYTITPINNVQNAAQSGRYAFAKFEWQPFLQRIIPIHDLRDFLGFGQYAGDDNYNMELVDSRFNTITFWPAYLEMFGYMGTLIIVCGFIVGFWSVYGEFCKDPGRWLLPLVIMIRAILLGVFTTSFSDPATSIFFIIACVYPVMPRPNPASRGTFRHDLRDEEPR